MAYLLKPAFLADLCLKSFNFFIREFNHFAAFYAYQMVVMSMPEGVLVMDMVFSQIDFPDQARVDQKPQSPINRSPGNILFCLSKLHKDLICFQMTICSKNLSQDKLPFLSKAEFFGLQVFCKYFSFFFHKFIFEI